MRLAPVPAAIERACRYSAAASDWRALCPSALPLPFVGEPPWPGAGVRVIRRPTVLDFGYGAPVENGSGGAWEDNLWRNRPCCFLHFGIYRETRYGPPLWRPEEGEAAVVGGVRGWLQPAESGGFAGSHYWANHMRFFFTEGSEHYAVTLHDFGPGTRALLDRLVRALEPADPLPLPLPARVPSPCDQYRGLSLCRKGPVAGIAVADGAPWVTKPERDEVVRIDHTTGEERGGVDLEYPSRIAGEDDALWVVAWKRADVPLVELDPETGAVRRIVPLGRVSATGIAAGEGAVWVSDGWHGRIARITGATGDVTMVETGRGASGVAVGADAVWVANTGEDTVSRIDPAAAEVVATVEVGAYPQGVAIAGGTVWVANTGDGTVMRIDPETNEVVATITVAHAPLALTPFGGCMWVADVAGDALHCVDLASEDVSARVATGPRPFALAADDDALWIATHRGIERKTEDELAPH